MDKNTKRRQTLTLKQQDEFMNLVHKQDTLSTPINSNFEILQLVKSLEINCNI